MISFGPSSRFLTLLDPGPSSYTFQTFGEGEEEGNKALTRVLHGSLVGVFDTLTALNRRGAGIFVTINETDGKGRKAENIKRVRAFWQDDDDGFDGAYPLEPSVVVSTSPGKFQRLWLADGLSKDDFAGLMRTMVSAYGSDKRAADVCRVLRLPGFYHTKRESYLVTIIEASGERYGRDELLEAFPAPKEHPTQQSAFPSTNFGQLSAEKPPTERPAFPSPTSNRLNAEETYRIKEALKQVDPGPYEIWLQVGMILHATYHGDGEGLYLWMGWASASTKFEEKEHRYKWGTFGKTDGRKLGLGTLFQLADEALYGD